MDARHLLFAVTALAACGPLWAGVSEYDRADADFASSKTRAEVLVELRQAQAQGMMNVSDDSYPIVARSETARTRSEVRAEAIEAAQKRTSDKADLYFGG